MKHFTVEEANAALAAVRPLVEEMMAQHRRLGRWRTALQELRQTVAGNGGGLDARRAGTLENAVREAEDALGRTVAEIHRLGAQVKDLERGLVDFPALHPGDGQTVLLCWHAGEHEIRYWHGLEEGFAGRKPLPF